MSDNPKLRKNGGKGTFFGRVLKGIGSVGKMVSPNLIGVITDATGLTDVAAITGLINKEEGLSQQDKEMLLKELEQDVIEMQEVTKRWQSDMMSDSWLSKNIRPLSLAFLTISLFVYVILDSSMSSFEVKNEWVDLLSSLLLLVYGGYFGTRAVEKITKIRQNSNNK